MTTDSDGWDAVFPIHEEVEDYAGRKRSFVITCFETPAGFTVRAEEKSRRDGGYQFASFSEISPSSALYRMRRKMYRGLATRHITRSDGALRMLHDNLSGRISCDGDGNVFLVVDGVPLGIDEIALLLASHEGWEFEFQIVDALA